MINKIVIFDGDCAFCNRSVIFILNKCKRQDIYVCSGGSIKGKELIEKYKIKFNPQETLIFIHNKNVYGKSNAALNICKSLKFPYNLLFIFKITPKFLRDKIYDIVAKKRKSIIKNNSCSFELATAYKDRIIE